jgi:nicotinate-nucleotide adenylyltransferase
VPIAVIDRPGWRLKALASPAGRALQANRLDARRAASLAERRPPAWVLLETRLSGLSSTEIRSRGKVVDAPAQQASSPAW